MNNNKKQKNKEIVLSQAIKADLKKDFESNFVEYALSVILNRAIPDLRDGLKTVQRRIIYSMYEQGLSSKKGFKTSSKTIGDVGGKYHRHGENAVYGAIVKMVQPFASNLPLVQGQGNFGSRDGDEAASSRYTQIRLTPVSESIIKYQDLDLTESYVRNYDFTLIERTYFLNFFPLLLINGAQNIAVGLATSILPHNTKEICDLIVYKLRNPDEDIYSQIGKIFLGPDFPTGGFIDVKIEELIEIYKAGNGPIRQYSDYEVVNEKEILFLNHPYSTIRGEIITQIVNQVGTKFYNISKIQDESEKEESKIRVIFNKKLSETELKNSLKLLYKYTDLSSVHSLNLTYIYKNKPVIGNLNQCISDFCELYKENLILINEKIKARNNLRLGILDAALILTREGREILKEIENLVEVEALRNYFREKFNFTENQIQYAISFPLSRFIKGEVTKYLEEKGRLENENKEIEKILSSPEMQIEKIISLLEKDPLYLSHKRSTKVLFSGEELEVKKRELHENYPTLLVLGEKDNAIKKIRFEEVRMQHKGGQGMNMGNWEKEGGLRSIIQTMNQDKVYAFTNLNRVYSFESYELIEKKRSDSAQSLNMFLSLEKKEQVIKIIGEQELLNKQYLVVISEDGYGKLISTSVLKKINKKGKVFFKKPRSVFTTIAGNSEESLILATTENKVVRVPLKSLPVYKNIKTGGAKLLSLSKKHKIVGAVVALGQKIITISKSGYGKLTEIEKIRLLKNRGGKGVYSSQIAGIYQADTSEFMAVSNSGKLIYFNSEAFQPHSIRAKGLKILDFVQDSSSESNKKDYVKDIINIKLLS